MDYDKLKEHYDNVIKKSKEFDSTKPVNDLNLLFPDFLDKLILCFGKYNEKYPSHDVYIVETYRSNNLQSEYYKSGKSKIRKNGMHHFGIAADIAFYIDGEFSYKGNYDYLRKIFTDEGLTVLNWELGHVQFIEVKDQETLRKSVLN
ncbi:MAG: hypothetical protein PHN88_02175 [Ignavibacteria bacterium]|nr:hypothetical protein [Ignavibacteria bacterium]